MDIVPELYRFGGERLEHQSDETKEIVIVHFLITTVDAQGAHPQNGKVQNYSLNLRLIYRRKCCPFFFVAFSKSNAMAIFRHAILAMLQI